MNTFKPGSPSAKFAAGFAMLEVLVTMVIVASGMLGTAAMIVQAMRANQSAQFRNQAVIMSADIAERMEANKAAAVAGSYVAANGTVPSVAATDCSVAACTPTQLAAYDLAIWQSQVSTLPGGNWTITQPVAGNPSTYEIVVGWVDRRSKTTYETAGTTETFSHTSTRMIFHQ